MDKQIQDCLIRIRETKPLILNLTNHVTMDFMANCLLALGAAPIMSEDKEELVDLVPLAHSINLNIGTLDAPFLDRCRQVICLAKVHNKPIVLDPVGAGATRRRTAAALEFIPDVTIVRGNSSEILALYHAQTKTLGVEAVHNTHESIDSGRGLSYLHDVVVAISGATDIIINSQRMSKLNFGSPLMTLVTGMGCALTAVIASFHAVEADPFTAANLATKYFGLCGTQAAQKADTPGDFRMRFLDTLYCPNFHEMEKYDA